MTEEQLRSLIRLKRHEQPPPGYFENLLHDVHRRQREELLRRPIWRIAWERAQAWMEGGSVGTPAFASGMAVLLAAGVLSINVLIPSPPAGKAPGQFAQTAPPSPSPASDILAAAPSAVPARVVINAEPRVLTLQPGAVPSLSLPPGTLNIQTGATPNQPVRYIIDQRPPSYDSPFDF